MSTLDELVCGVLSGFAGGRRGRGGGRVGEGQTQEEKADEGGGEVHCAEGEVVKRCIVVGDPLKTKERGCWEDQRRVREGAGFYRALEAARISFGPPGLWLGCLSGCR